MKNSSNDLSTSQNSTNKTIIKCKEVNEENESIMSSSYGDVKANERLRNITYVLKDATSKSRQLISNFLSKCNWKTSFDRTTLDVITKAKYHTLSSGEINLSTTNLNNYNQRYLPGNYIESMKSIQKTSYYLFELERNFGYYLLVFILAFLILKITEIWVELTENKIHIEVEKVLKEIELAQGISILKVLFDFYMKNLFYTLLELKVFILAALIIKRIFSYKFDFSLLFDNRKVKGGNDNDNAIKDFYFSDPNFNSNNYNSGSIINKVWEKEYLVSELYDDYFIRSSFTLNYNFISIFEKLESSELFPNWRLEIRSSSYGTENLNVLHWEDNLNKNISRKVSIMENSVYIVEYYDNNIQNIFTLEANKNDLYNKTYCVFYSKISNLYSDEHLSSIKNYALNFMKFCSFELNQMIFFTDSNLETDFIDEIKSFKKKLIK